MRGPPRCASAYEILKSSGFHVDFGFQNGFLDFNRFQADFWISKRISRFQSGFLDFKADFWISFYSTRQNNQQNTMSQAAHRQCVH